jgi:hypothetical protein
VREARRTVVRLIMSCALLPRALGSSWGGGSTVINPVIPARLPGTPTIGSAEAGDGLVAVL